MRPIDIGTKSAHTRKLRTLKMHINCYQRSVDIGAAANTGPVLCVQEVGIVSRLKISLKRKSTTRMAHDFEMREPRLHSSF